MREPISQRTHSVRDKVFVVGVVVGGGVVVVGGVVFVVVVVCGVVVVVVGDGVVGVGVVGENGDPVLHQAGILSFTNYKFMLIHVNSC